MRTATYLLVLFCLFMIIDKRYSETDLCKQFYMIEQASLRQIEKTEQKDREEIFDILSRFDYGFDCNELAHLYLLPNSAKEPTREKAYIQRFHQIAAKEMLKYGIPASIKLAQGILESDRGDSRLTREDKSHFGIKGAGNIYRTREYDNGRYHARLASFQGYETDWDSFRAHSILLTTRKRYRSLFDIPITDYKAWAKGLKKAGYATGAHYADKLIDIIERNELWRLDQLAEMNLEYEDL